MSLVSSSETTSLSRHALACSVGHVASALLRDGSSPETAFPVVTNELVKSLIPPGDSGRATIWIKAAFGALTVAATSSVGEDDVSMEQTIDTNLDLENLSFLRGLTQGGRGDGLYLTEQQIRDMDVPNSPGYDQLIYGACLKNGHIFGVVGVGRKAGAKVSAKDDEKVTVAQKWGTPHLTAVQATADMLRMPFLQSRLAKPRRHTYSDQSNLKTNANVASTSDGDRDDDDWEYFAVNSKTTFQSSMTETDLSDQKHDRTSDILGIVADKLGPHGLISVSAWDYDLGTLILQPGRRKRLSTNQSFLETPGDHCEYLDFSCLHPMVRFDCIELEWVNDQMFGHSELEKDMKYHQHRLEKGFDLSVVRLSKRARPFAVTRSLASRICGIDVDKVNSHRVFIMPVMVKGCLRTVLSFAFDAEAYGAETTSEVAFLQQGLRARKRLMALGWEKRMLRSSIVAPDISALVTEVKSGNAFALVGSGFSMPAGLMGWAKLLESLLDSARSTQCVKDDEADFIKDLISQRTGDSFDQAAQTLEDILGVERMQHLVGTLLAINFDSMPRAMQQRVRSLLDIPWRSILTTNYDMCLVGPTPQCTEAGESYIRSLRKNDSSIGDHLVGLAPKAPVIKLHGCAQRGHIVLTRQGFRRLLYGVPGYKIFLQSMMASRTMVSLGHSGTDAYINDLNSELLTMFRKSDLPLRYNIAPASDGKVSFARQYDGMHYLSWDKDKYGYGVFDYLLQKLSHATSYRARMRTMLRGRRILLIKSEGLSKPKGWKLIELASLLFSILPSVEVHLLDGPEQMSAAVERAASNVSPYDVALLVYGGEKTNAAIESNRLMAQEHHLPLAVVESNHPNCRSGIEALRGRGIKIVQSKADTAEFLFNLFEELTYML